MRASRNFKDVLAENDLGIQDRLDMVCKIINSRPVACTDSEVITPSLLAFGAPHLSDGKSLKELRDHFYKVHFDLLRRRHQPGTIGRKSWTPLVGANVLVLISPSTKTAFPFKLGKIIDIRGSRYYVKCRDSTLKVVGSQEMCPLKLVGQCVLQPYDVSRVGCRLATDYTVGDGQVEFTGTVVVDNVTDLEVQWDEAGWNNELVNWGACRIL